MKFPGTTFYVRNGFSTQSLLANALAKMLESQPDCKQVLLTKRSGNQALLKERWRGYAPRLFTTKWGANPYIHWLQNGCGVDRTASTVVLPETKSFLQKDKKKGFAV